MVILTVLKICFISFYYNLYLLEFLFVVIQPENINPSLQLRSPEAIFLHYFQGQHIFLNTELLMNFDLVRLRENYYKMFVKTMRKALIPDGNVSKLCFSVDQTLSFNLDGSILQRSEGRNEKLDEMFVCFLCIEALHEES